MVAREQIAASFALPSLAIRRSPYYSKPDDLGPLGRGVPPFEPSLHAFVQFIANAFPVLGWVRYRGDVVVVKELQ